MAGGEVLHIGEMLDSVNVKMGDVQASMVGLANTMDIVARNTGNGAFPSVRASGDIKVVAPSIDLVDYRDYGEEIYITSQMFRPFKYFTVNALCNGSLRVFVNFLMPYQSSLDGAPFCYFAVKVGDNVFLSKDGYPVVASGNFVFDTFVDVKVSAGDTLSFGVYPVGVRHHVRVLGGNYKLPANSLSFAWSPADLSVDNCVVI